MEERNTRHFGGNRELAIMRDGEKCCTCGMTRKQHRAKYGRDITVDHINGKGRYTLPTERDNSLGNLRTLCLSCHGKKDILRRRSYFGDERHWLPNHKLTETDVREIKSLLPTVPHRKLAKQFHVSESTIRHISTGRRWHHIQVT